jgi:hypothetical protein
VGANIRSSQKEAGYVEEHAKQQNHEQNTVADLLKVPQYADLLDDNNNADANEDGEESGLVKSCKGWRKEMAKWVQEVQARSELSDGVNDSDEEEHCRMTHVISNDQSDCQDPWNYCLLVARNQRSMSS